MQPDIREQFPQLAMSLPPVAGGDASEIATVYKPLRIPFSKNGDAVWAVAQPGDSALTPQPTTFKTGLVPALPGLGWQDALFLAEHAGLRIGRAPRRERGGQYVWTSGVA